MSFNIIIKNGKVVSGTGNPWFKADVGIKNHKIVKIGKLVSSKAERVIDVKGLVVCPGFIDAHSHSDMVIPFNPGVESTIRQGITTLITGNCGSTLAPVDEATRDLLIKHVSPHVPKDVKLEIPWKSFREYLDYEERLRVASNVGHLVGHGTVRIAVMGFENRPPTMNELEEMRRLVAEAMKAGALGMSTGLIYPPGIYAKTDEIIELAKVVTKYGGVYTSHIRGEGKTLIESVKEAVEIGEKAGLPVEISHHKASGRQYWGKTSETLKLIEEARSRGVDITCDQYPYTAGMTSLVTLLPPWVHEGGMPKLLNRLRSSEERKKIRWDIEKGLPEWENMAMANGWESIRIGSVNTDKNRLLEGKNLVEVVKEMKKPDEFTAIFDLLLEEEGQVTMIVFSQNEEDVRRVMKSPFQMVGTDSWSVAPYGVMSVGKPHPRFYGTYPRLLGRYVREARLLTLEEAIRKMTSFPAQKFRLRDRGIIMEGAWADIVIFNPEQIIDKATYDDPHKYPTGIEYVLVNGQVIIEKGTNTGVRAGKILHIAW